MMTPTYVSAAQLAEILNVTTDQLDQWVQDGHIKPALTLPNGEVRYDPSRVANALSPKNNAAPGPDDIIQIFIRDVVNQCVWDLVPYTFLYDVYRKWTAEEYPTAPVLGKNTFMQALKMFLTYSEIWAVKKTTHPLRKSRRMDKIEPLIAKYNLTQWARPAPDDKMYYGLIRKRPAIAASVESQDDGTIC